MEKEGWVKLPFSKSFLKIKNTFSICVVRLLISEQIKLFSEEILEDHPIRSFISTFDDWEKAFIFLVNEAKEKRILIQHQFIVFTVVQVMIFLFEKQIKLLVNIVKKARRLKIMMS